MMEAITGNDDKEERADKKADQTKITNTDVDSDNGKSPRASVTEETPTRITPAPESVINHQPSEIDLEQIKIVEPDEEEVGHFYYVIDEDDTPPLTGEDNNPPETELCVNNLT